MTAQIAAAPLSPRAPDYTPIGTDTVVRDLTPEAYKAGVMIYGDPDTGRSSRALQMMEGKLGTEQCIVFSYNGRAFRLNENPAGKPSGHVVHTFGGKRGREAHGFEIMPEDGAIFGTIVARTGESFAFNLACFDYEQVTSFLKEFLSTFMTTAINPATIMIDDFNVGIARRRGGGDSMALKNFHALVVRGRDDGIKFIGISTSPGEVPLEGRNEVTTSILTGTKVQPHLLQLIPIVGANIGTYARFGNLGISRQPAGHHWLKMPTDRNDDLYYLPRAEFATGAGNALPVQDDFDTPNIAKLISEVKASRPKSGKKSKKNKKGHTRTKNADSRSNAITMEDVYDAVRAAGIGNVISHCSVARTLVMIESGDDLTRRFVMDAAVVRDKSLTEPFLIHATRWMTSSTTAIGKIVSPSLAAAAYVVFARADEAQAIVFFDEFAGRRTRGVIVQQLVDRLMKDSAPGKSNRRLELLTEAWTRYLAAARPLGQVVSLTPTHLAPSVRKAA